MYSYVMTVCFWCTKKKWYQSLRLLSLAAPWPIHGRNFGDDKHEITPMFCILSGSLLLAVVVKRILVVCFVALRPKSTAMVMAGRSVHLTTLFFWASLNKQLTSTSCTYFRL